MTTATVDAAGASQPPLNTAAHSQDDLTPPSATTTIATIAVRVPESTIVIALLKVSRLSTDIIEQLLAECRCARRTAHHGDVASHVRNRRRPTSSRLTCEHPS